MMTFSPVSAMLHQPSQASIKRVRALVRKKDRRTQQRHAIEGVKLVQETLRWSPGSIREVWVSPRLLRTDDGRRLRQQLDDHRVVTFEVADRLLDGIGDATTHQGALVVVDTPSWALADLLDPDTRPVLLVADGVQDPGNVGALTRVAAAFAADAVVLVGSADPWHPRASRAAAGASLRIPIGIVDDVAELVRALTANGYPIVLASPRGGRHPAPMLPMALVVGGEGHGPAPELARAARTIWTIPMTPTVESLNVATAAAVLLYGSVGRKLAADQSPLSAD